MATLRNSFKAKTRLVSNVKQRFALPSCTTRISHVRDGNGSALISDIGSIRQTSSVDDTSHEDEATPLCQSAVTNRSLFFHGPIQPSRRFIMSGSNRCYHNSAIRQQSSNQTSNASRDTRMAGRRRFYKVVDITPLAAPWEHFEKENQKDNTDTVDNDDDDMVDNPISAGVDGTNSATNVNLIKPTQAILRQALNPHPMQSEEDSCCWYGITLDGRTIRTPLGTPLAVPSATLALAIASEWDAQIKTISPAQMPLMTLVCTTLDQLILPSVRVKWEEELMAYLRNDTTCFQSDATEDRLLSRRQSNAWGNMLQFVESDFGLGHAPAVATGAGEGLIMSRKRKNKAFAGLPHPEALLEKAQTFLESCTAWELAVMQMVTVEAKSFLVGMTMVKNVTQRDGSNPFLSETNKAVVASRVEEEFQIENWGLVEGGHDYDRLNCSINIHAASFLLQNIVSSSSK